MIKLDDQECKIIRALIRNPRSSDNSISKYTKIPVMTVNRKRKKLEEKGLLQYYAHIKTGEGGTHLFHAAQLYIIQLSSGHTKTEYLHYVEKNIRMHPFNSMHILESYIGEQDGRMALIMIIKGETDAQLTELFNGKIVHEIKKNFGESCITRISTAKITFPVRLFHNYLPWLNMENGKMRDDWPEEWIFTDVASEELKETTSELRILKKIEKEGKLKQYL